MRSHYEAASSSDSPLLEVHEAACNAWAEGVMQSQSVQLSKPCLASRGHYPQSMQWFSTPCWQPVLTVAVARPYYAAVLQSAPCAQLRSVPLLLAYRAWGRWQGVPVGRYGAAYGACVDGWGCTFVGVRYRYMARQSKCYRAVL